MVNIRSDEDASPENVLDEMTPEQAAKVRFHCFPLHLCIVRAQLLSEVKQRQALPQGIFMQRHGLHCKYVSIASEYAQRCISNDSLH